MYNFTKFSTVEFVVYYGHLGTSSDYQGVLILQIIIIILFAILMDYAGVLIFKFPH